MTTPNQTLNQIESWFQQGVAAANAEQHAEAYRYFQQVHELDPDNIGVLLWMARVAPDRWATLALLHRVLKIEPDNKQARESILRIRGRVTAEEASPRIEVQRTFRPLRFAPGVLRKSALHLRRFSKVLPVLYPFLQRLAFGLGALLLISYLVFWGLSMAQQASAGAAVDFWGSAGEAVWATAEYIGQRLWGPAEMYVWQRAPIPAAEFVWLLLRRSGVLLLAALSLASVVGVALGILAARSPTGGSAGVSKWLPLLSTVVVSLPSFLLGMILWIINFSVHRRFNVAVLPPTGYGLDMHLVMPALVLAARPLAQITRVTYVTFSDVFQQDYIRTAVAKGVRSRRILWVHALRNGLAPIVTTMASGLRFSMSSLPVVEFFFVWPGLGLVLLQAIEEGNSHLATDLVLTLGIIFILTNLLLEVAYRLIDPRLAQPLPAGRRQEVSLSWAERLRDWSQAIRFYLSRLAQGLREMRTEKQPAASRSAPSPAIALNPSEAAAEKARQAYQRRTWRRATLANLPLVVGTLLVLAFFFVALFGDSLAPANPYRTSGIRSINGEIFSPPFPPTLPSPSGILDFEGIRGYFSGLLRLKDYEFPWGSDPVGRDILGLVLVGAKRTLALGLFATLARLVLGGVLGVWAGWSRGGRLDRLASSLVEVLHAFPSLLFAMVLILALDIRKGMSVFIIALAVIGWGEIMLLVRSRVMSLKEQPFIESAVAAGSSVPQIFVRHLLPNLLPTLITVAALEMAGVLLLLAELGFLNIFMGGGAQAEVFADAGKYHYSDVPEWGALLSNIRDWWRSYPWMAWYPGLFFALAILAFNLWGEGLRTMLDRVGFGLSRLFNRYTLAFSGLLVFGLVWTLRSVAPLGQYTSATRSFDVQHVMADVEYLSSPELAGREVGTPGARAAAEYIAARMKEVGLQPAGGNDTYLQVLKRTAFHLTAIPELAVVDDQGATVGEFVYRRDYIEMAASSSAAGRAEGQLLLTLLGPPSQPGIPEAYQLDRRQTAQSILLVTSLENLQRIQHMPRLGALVVTRDPDQFNRRYIMSTQPAGRAMLGQPTLAITPQVAERLLRATGHDFEQLSQEEEAIAPGASQVLPLETRARLSIVGQQEAGEFIHVIGFIPGGRAAEGLDDQAIIVSAYYDGLGVGPDGSLYPGANDNASGVATMLEIARAWREAPYQPRKTIIFVAWAGGEQHESLSVFEVMNAKTGFATAFEVEAVIELSGVGAGAGRRLLIAEGSSYRLTELLQAAARRVGARTTIRGNYPHTGVYQLPPRGGRSALTAVVSWEGSDALAHTALDTVQLLDPNKVEAAGRTVFLAVMVMGRQVEY